MGDFVLSSGDVGAERKQNREFGELGHLERNRPQHDPRFGAVDARRDGFGQHQNKRERGDVEPVEPALQMDEPAEIGEGCGDEGAQAERDENHLFGRFGEPLRGRIGRGHGGGRDGENAPDSEEDDDEKKRPIEAEKRGEKRAFGTRLGGRRGKRGHYWFIRRRSSGPMRGWFRRSCFQRLFVTTCSAYILWPFPVRMKAVPSLSSMSA